MDDKHESTNAFTFMRSYFEQIEEVKAISTETALEYLEALCRYALDHKRYDGEDPTIRALMHGAYPIIDKAGIKRRANQRNGVRGGRPKGSGSGRTASDNTGDAEEEEITGDAEESHAERTADFLRELNISMNLNASERQIQNFIGYHVSHDWTKARTPEQVKEKFRRWIEEDRTKEHTSRPSKKPYIPEGRPENEMSAQILELEKMAHMQLSRQSM